MIECTVVIPTHNRPEKLSKAVESVIGQSYTNWELIIVNDSDDEAPVKRFVKECNNHKIKYLKNQGIKGGNGARNTGIKNARGNYIAFLDDDDQWFPSKLEKQIASLKAKNEKQWAGCYCGYLLKDEDIWREESRKLLEGNFLFQQLIGNNAIGAMSTLLIRRYVFDEIGYLAENLVRHQDIHFLIKYFEKYKLACVKECLMKVCGHRRIATKKLEASKLHLIGYLRKNASSLTEKEIKQYFAYEYRSLAICFLQESNRRKFLQYIRMSLTTTYLPVHKYLKVAIAIVDAVFNLNATKLFSKLRSRYQLMVR
jgi:glycosyltransferase involved in cell wall biosynthesis